MKEYIEKNDYVIVRLLGQYTTVSGTVETIDRSKGTVTLKTDSGVITVTYGTIHNYGTK